MPLAAFDTLAYARQLQDSGISQKQAEAQAQALANALKDSVADLATKRDLAQVESNLKHEISESIAEARAEAKQDYTRLDGKLTMVYAVLGINTAVLLCVFWMMFRYIIVK